MEPVIHPAARKHGVTKEDILHAYRHPVWIFTDQGDAELTMHVGPATNGTTMLEVGFATSDNGEVIIVHAMRARTKYLRKG